MGRFKLGFSLGTALGAGLFWLNATEKGRKKREELLDHAAVVYEEVKEKIAASEAWKNMNESEYMKMVNDIVDTYAVKTGIAAHVKKLIQKVMRLQWKKLLRQMKEESLLTKK